MKITFVLPVVGLTGGIRVIAIYADRLKKRGHDVTVVSTPHPQATWKEQVKSLVRGCGWVKYHKHPVSHLDNVDVPHYIIDRYRPIVDADLPDADVVIATWWETAEWVDKFSPAKGAKAYFIQHHEVFDYMPVNRVKATWRLPLHKITITQWLRDLAQTEYGDHDVSLVPNSVDLEQFYAEPRNKQPIPTIGMLYAPIPWKGVDISLKAIEIARKSIPNLRLVAFGSSEILDEYPLPSNSHYTKAPHQAAIREIYASCDAWLFASRSEGFGLPILEAMACRTPVIGVPTGAAPEFLADGAGILVKPEDPEDMARAIVSVCQLTNENWRILSDNAHDRVTHYTWDNATDLFEAALVRAIGRDRKHRVQQISKEQIT